METKTYWGTLYRRMVNGEIIKEGDRYTYGVLRIMALAHHSVGDPLVSECAEWWRPLEVKTVDGVTYYRIEHGTILGPTDRWINHAWNYRIGPVAVGKVNKENDWWRPLVEAAKPEPSPATVTLGEKVYRELAVGEVVANGDLISTKSSAANATAVNTSIGNPVAPSDYHFSWWRPVPDRYLASTGELWYRLHAGMPIAEGDLTGVLKPTTEAPWGDKVRKSRHVWRKAKTIQEPAPEYPNTLEGNLKYLEACYGTSAASWDIAPVVTDFETDFDDEPTKVRDTSYRQHAKTASFTREYGFKDAVWPACDPDTYVDSDGRPWRRLPAGTKIRACDRWGVKYPNLGITMGVGRILGHTNCWRPAGPPVDSIDYKGIKCLRVKDDDILQSGDIALYKGDRFPTGNVGMPPTREPKIKYYRPVKAIAPKAPPKAYIEYLRKQVTTVDGYSPQDLVRYLESLSCE